MVEEVYIDPTTKALVINGRKFRMAYEKKGEKHHAGKLVFKPQSEDYEQKLVRAADYLAKNASGLTVEMMIQEALRTMTPRDLARLERNIEEKKKPIVKKGCVALEIGGQPVYLIG